MTCGDWTVRVARRYAWRACTLVVFGRRLQGRHWWLRVGPLAVEKGPRG